MSTIESRNKLKSKIDELTEDELLVQLLEIIELDSLKTEMLIIPEEHKAGIKTGLLQLKEGKTKTHEELMAKYKSWT